MSVKGLKVLLMVSIFGLILALTACGSSDKAGTNQQSDKETYTIKLPSVSSDDSFVVTGFKKFKELVEEKSEGRINVEIYAGGTLSSSDEENLQLLRDGSAEMIGMPSFLASQVGGVGGFNIYDIPYLFEDRNELYEFAEGAVGQELTKEFEEKTNTKVLGYYDIGAYAMLNSKHQINQPNDLNGLNIRTPQSSLYIDTVKAMGGNPTAITFAELYTAIQQGTVDGATTTLPIMYDSQLYDVGEYLTQTNQIMQTYMLVINKTFFEGLPANLQDAVTEAANETIQFSRELTIKEEKSAIEGFKEKGVEVIELTPEQLEAFKKSVQPALEKNIDLVGKEVYENTLKELNK